MRHGAYEGHRPGHHAPADAPLSAEGQAQIRRSLPLPDGITAIITSPVLRAHQTADLLSHLTDLPIIGTSTLLAEWRAPTIVIGHTPRTYPAAYLAWREKRTADPSLPCQDGESLTDLHARAQTCAGYLSSTSRIHGSVIAVSHKLLLGMITRLTSGPPAFETSALDNWHFAERRPLTATFIEGE
jgi:probable phosphoglycerate mutase